MVSKQHQNIKKYVKLLPFVGKKTYQTVEKNYEDAGVVGGAWANRDACVGGGDFGTRDAKNVSTLDSRATS